MWLMWMRARRVGAAGRCRLLDSHGHVLELEELREEDEIELAGRPVTVLADDDLRLLSAVPHVRRLVLRRIPVVVLAVEENDEVGILLDSA